MDEDVVSVESPHLWRWTRFNLGACLMAPYWAIGYRVWIGLLVPVPAFIAGVIGYSLPSWGFLNYFDPVRLVLFWVPAIAFGLKADGLAWKSNPDRWTPEEYLRQQRIWVWVAFAYLAITFALSRFEFGA